MFTFNHQSFVTHSPQTDSHFFSNQMNTHQLFRYSRLRLAFWYAGVMAIILSLSGLIVYRFLIQSQWKAMESELESIAEILHDSLEPMLPSSGEATTVLQRILPELCLVEKPC